jgi:ABC-type sugar transport system substrate-binding protein
MRVPIRALLAPVLMALAAAAAARAAPVAYDPPPETATLKPGPNLETASGYCGACHSVDYILTQPPSVGAGFWQAEVTKMQKAYGASIPADDAKKIVDYLNATYRKPAA